MKGKKTAKRARFLGVFSLALVVQLGAYVGYAHPLAPATVPTDVYRYDLSGAPNASEWMIFSVNSTVLGVSSRDAGSLAGYPSLASLNQTSIGASCQSAVNDSCASFASQAQQGWFVDGSTSLLYVHYRMGPGGTEALSVTVEAQSSASPGSLQTQQTGTSTTDQAAGGGGGGAQAQDPTVSSSQTTTESSDPSGLGSLLVVVGGIVLFSYALARALESK